MTDRLFECLKKVADEDSFLEFVRALGRDRADAERSALTPEGFRGEWANQSIAEFIEAGVAWAEDSDFAARPGPKPANPWALFAQFLWAGRGYE